MNFNKFIIAILCMAINYMHGQTVINGKIYDKENQEPLVGANIQLVSDLNIGTITNSSGYFELKTYSLLNLLWLLVGQV